MVGIASFGAYIPLHRLKRADIARAWGGGAMGGEKAVANFDEDPITMAVAAAMDCLAGVDRNTVDALYFATTTSPYQEKQAAALIAAALDLQRQVVTSDFTGSLRAGTIALRAALDAAQAGTLKNILVVASDCRLGSPRSGLEQLFGDGAAAFLVSAAKPAAALEDVHTHADAFIDLWRVKGDDFVNSWEDRFILTQGYMRNIAEAVKAILDKLNASPRDFPKVVFYAPDARRHRELAADLGFDYQSQVQDSLIDRIGNTGVACAPLMLVAALENSQPGESILFLNYGDGADGFIFKATKQIAKVSHRRGIKGYLESKRYLTSYEKYASYRELLPIEFTRRPAFTSYPPLMWRDTKWVLGCNGSRCQQCGRLFYPPQRICVYCQAKDKFDYVRLAEQKGKLFNLTKDYLALSLDPPEVFCLVNLDIGARFYCKMTDRDPDKVEVDMPVELTFRKFHQAGGYPNYFWKCMPLREAWL